MSKAVLISIKPCWAKKIETGEKTIEVRRTRPRIETSFKCYIYETKGKTETPWVDEDGHFIYKGRGQVIGEFICDDIYKYSAEFVKSPEDTYEEIRQIWIDSDGEEYDAIITTNELDNPSNCELCNDSCLSFDDLRQYIGVNLHEYPFYGWHISDLKIYDEPKELSEFRNPCPYGYLPCWDCPSCDKDKNDNLIQCFNTVSRPPLCKRVGVDEVTTFDKWAWNVSWFQYEQDAYRAFARYKVDMRDYGYDE